MDCSEQREDDDELAVKETNRKNIPINNFPDQEQREDDDDSAVQETRMDCSENSVNSKARDKSVTPSCASTKGATFENTRIRNKEYTKADPTQERPNNSPLKKSDQFSNGQEEINSPVNVQLDTRVGCGL
ncbi:hypothetical protein L2E82_45562 [Cichorium intybus]|uniref:Uncharacterized protein n=1 Tax=Cichorium intybus TaxID=13427 RepID=A0ACB8ZTV5_CICIN|nr:hypothetical protein L2E82_45562 [Cichorium intybus]